MDCRWIERYLIEIIEGSVKTMDMSHNIEEHLRTCPKCANLVKRFRLAWDMLENPERIEGSSVFEDLLLEKIQETQKDSLLVEIRERLFRALRPAILTSGLIFALFFGVHLGNISKEKPEMSPDFALEAGFLEYSSGDLIILDDISRGSAADFLLNYRVNWKEESP